MFRGVDSSDLPDPGEVEDLHIHDVFDCDGGAFEYISTNEKKDLQNLPSSRNESFNFGYADEFETDVRASREASKLLAQELFTILRGESLTATRLENETPVLAKVLKHLLKKHT